MIQQKPDIKILIVDDREDNLLSIETILDKQDYKLYKALSGREALKILLKEQDFSLILMDVQMPGLNGFETASLIYEREKLKDIPIIFITAFSYGEENVFKGYETGAVDYIYKPINPELLRVKVSIFIELYRKNFILKQQEQTLININKELQSEINERIRYEEELKVKNQQLVEAQKMSNLGSWQWDLKSGSITGSAEFYQVYNLNPEKSIDFSRFRMIVHPDDAHSLNDFLVQVVSEHRPVDLIYRINGDGENVKNINLRARAVFDSHNNPVKVFGTCQDITLIKNTEEQLRIFYVLERCLNEIYIFDAVTLEYQYVNEDACRNLGYNSAEFHAMTPLDVMPELKKDDFFELTRNISNSFKEKVVFKTVHKRKDGSCYPVEVHLQLIEKLNKRVYLATIIDITEREKAEDKIKASLREKELLLKEIYHRVKNNLQVISSLLNLQSRHLDDEEVKAIFDESKNRILSMALIHEKLYKYNDLSRINFTEYVQDLAHNLLDSYRSEISSITLNIDNTEPVLLDIEKSIPLGLCVNEVLTNSIKHAFPGKQKGEIKIRLHEDADNLYLSLSDNGVGISKDIDLQNLQSLGMQLVFSLVEQLEGNMEVERNGKTEFRFIIPINHSDTQVPHPALH